MRVILFYPSFLSDWKNGIAHFMRGVATELMLAGHEVACYEPEDSIHLRELLRQHGSAPVAALKKSYPLLSSRRYAPADPQLDQTLDRADLVLVHDALAPDLIRQIGEHRLRRGDYRLLFHYTHSVPSTDPRLLASYGLENYDGVVTSCETLRRIFVKAGWAKQAWVWSEAADTRLFYPRNGTPEGDVIFVGNWLGAEDDRTFEEFLARPVRTLGLSARVHGVGYPREAQELLRRHGIDYAGWLPNYQVPDLYSCYTAALHVPHESPERALPGQAPVRLFEALACGIPVVSGPWEDADGLLEAGRDYLMGQNEKEITRHLEDVLNDGALRQSLIANGREKILSRHTCAHRARELTAIARSLGLVTSARAEILHRGFKLQTAAEAA